MILNLGATSGPGQSTCQPPLPSRVALPQPYPHRPGHRLGRPRPRHCPRRAPRSPPESRTCRRSPNCSKRVKATSNSPSNSPASFVESSICTPDELIVNITGLPSFFGECPLRRGEKVPSTIPINSQALAAVTGACAGASTSACKPRTDLRIEGQACAPRQAWRPVARLGQRAWVQVRAGAGSSTTTTTGAGIGAGGRARGVCACASTSPNGAGMGMGSCWACHAAKVLASASGSVLLAQVHAAPPHRPPRGAGASWLGVITLVLGTCMTVAGAIIKAVGARAETEESGTTKRGIPSF